MKKTFLFIAIAVLTVSCISRKEYLRKEWEVLELKDKTALQKQEISKLQIEIEALHLKMTDTDNDGVIDAYDACPVTPGGIYTQGCPDSDRDGVLDKDDKCPTVEGKYSNSGCPEVSENMERSLYIEYFQRLRPTRSVVLSKFFKKGSTLKQCNAKLIAVLEGKLKIPVGSYKYFAISKENYGIVTKKECMTKEGVTINKEKCTPDKDCRWYELSCVEEGYSRFYLFLITKKLLGESAQGFDEVAFKKLFETDALDSNWLAIPELKLLLSNSANVLTEDYSIVVKLFEIKKEGNFGDPWIMPDPTYNFQTQIENQFKNQP